MSNVWGHLCEAETKHLAMVALRWRSYHHKNMMWNSLTRNLQTQMQILPNNWERGEARKDMAATHSGVPAKMKLVPMGGSSTCLRKKMGKNLMVMPDANPNNTSEVARK